MQGSLINRVQEEMRSQDPVVGMGVTEMCYSDRHAYSIVRVDPNGKRIWIQRDTATRTDDRGMSDAQEYKYEPDTSAAILELRLNKRGSWKLLHSPKGSTFMVGGRDEHYDFSF